MKGTFSTPRSLGSVDQIVPYNVQIWLKKGPGIRYKIGYSIQEGETPNPPPDDIFIMHTESGHSMDMAALTPSQKKKVDDFMGLLVDLYVAEKGYSDVTVTP